MSVAKRKDHRFDIRATADQKATIEQAALLKQTSATNFIMDAAYEVAQKVIQDQYHFMLTEVQWKAFCQALDSPPKDNPKLRALMSLPTSWEK